MDPLMTKAFLWTKEGGCLNHIPPLPSPNYY
jgi:hypothetical protein